MTPRLQRWMALMLVVCALIPLRTLAQTPPSGPGMAPPQTQLPQDQLDSLLAPIALYPDQLLSQVLMASTYPLEVVEAARFVQQNPGLKGEALDQALGTKTWDPSVMSLAAFPQVLVMMNDKLEWTQQLGDAFLANEGQVMQTVQSLRGRAQAAGNLQDTAQQKVIVQDRTIIIQPAQPQVVYVPVYNPTVIYGPWWVPAYRPWFWYPPPIYGYPPLSPVFGVGFVWGSAWAVSSNHWGWAHPNWRGGNINITVNNNYFYNRRQYQNRYQNGNWQHLPEHRKGVAYRDTNVQNRYVNTNSAAVQSREAYRGREPVQSTQTQPGAGPRTGPTNRPGTAAVPPTTMPSSGSPMTRQSAASGGSPVEQRTSTPMSRQSAGTSAGPAGSAPTFNANQSRSQTQQYSNRGAQSRATMDAAPSRNASGGAPAHGGGGPAHGGGGGGGGDGGGGGGRGR
jgi:Protein of unknown function (DUF3300)